MPKKLFCSICYEFCNKVFPNNLVFCTECNWGLNIGIEEPKMIDHKNESEYKCVTIRNAIQRKESLVLEKKEDGAYKAVNLAALIPDTMKDQYGTFTFVITFSPND